MKCKQCDDYYFSTEKECPHCGAINPKYKKQPLFNTWKMPPESKADIFSWMHQMKSKYKADDKHFRTITENWSKEKCMSELRKFSLRQIALKKISQTEETNQ